MRRRKRCSSARASTPIRFRSAGRIVYLRSTANLSTGGTATDVTDVIHPDNREMAERAVRAIGLDVGGVDFLSKDITESYRTIGGGICEVNAAPGFRMHVAPSEGKGRDVAAPVVTCCSRPGSRGARADCRDHRHQRQDHDGAHAGACDQNGRLSRRASPPRTGSTSTASARCRET